MGNIYSELKKENMLVLTVSEKMILMKIVLKK